MAESVTVVGIQFQTGGDAQVAKAFKRLGREAGVLKKNFGSLSDKSLRKVKQQLLGVNKATGNSINSMQAQKTALQGLRNMADVTGNEFKQLTRDIALLDQKMKQAAAGGGAGGLKSRLKGFAKGAGAIAAGGILAGQKVQLVAQLVLVWVALLVRLLALLSVRKLAWGANKLLGWLNILHL